MEEAIANETNWLMQFWIPVIVAGCSWILLVRLVPSTDKALDKMPRPESIVREEAVTQRLEYVIKEEERLKDWAKQLAKIEWELGKEKDKWEREKGRLFLMAKYRPKTPELAFNPHAPEPCYSMYSKKYQDFLNNKFTIRQNPATGRWEEVPNKSTRMA